MSGRPRHFASLDQLLSALSLRALSMVADAMEDEIARVPVGGDALPRVAPRSISGAPVGIAVGFATARRWHRTP